MTTTTNTTSVHFEQQLLYPNGNEIVNTMNNKQLQPQQQCQHRRNQRRRFRYHDRRRTKSSSRQSSSRSYPTLPILRQLVLLVLLRCSGTVVDLWSSTKWQKQQQQQQQQQQQAQFLVSVVNGFLMKPARIMKRKSMATTRPAAVSDFRNRLARTSSHSMLLFSSSSPSSTADERQLVDIVICGGGPCGLLSAIMLSQKFLSYQIKLFDERPQRPQDPDDATYWSSDLDKRYLIGLGGRGITALETFGVWDEVVGPFCQEVPRRIDWNSAQGPDPVETIRIDKRYRTQVLPRDKLVSCLYQHIITTQQQNGEDGRYKNLELFYGQKVEPVKISVNKNNNNANKNEERVLIDVMDLTSSSSKDDSEREENQQQQQRGRKKLASRFVVAADGSARTFANEMERLDDSEEYDDNDDEAAAKFRVVRYDDDNQRVYKNIPFQIPLGDNNKNSYTENPFSLGWDVNTNYAVRTDRIIFDALPANDKGDFVGVLLLMADDEMARPNVDPVVFKTFLQEQVPQFVGMFDETTIQSVAERPPSFLPRFRYITPRMHQSYRTVLMGDCAKTVKPYFGMGANSALEDVKLLAECIDKNQQDLYEAIGDFSDKRSPDIETLVRISHDLDRPGVAGVFSFLIPIILDGIFSKLAPDVFSPNIISLLQDEQLTFQDAATRKRTDRIGQVAILSIVLLMFWEGFQFLSSVVF